MGVGCSGAVLVVPDVLGVAQGFLGEEGAVVSRDAVLAGSHQFLGSIDRFIEILGGFINGPGLSGLGIGLVVLAVSTLKQADPGLDGQGDVLAYVGVVHPGCFSGDVVAGEVEVLEDVFHGVLTAVTRLVEHLLVISVNRGEIVRHTTEGKYLVPILQGPPETGGTLVMVIGGFRESGHLLEVCQEVVDVVDGIPVTRTPSALDVGVPVIYVVSSPGDSDNVRTCFTCQ